MPKGRCLLYYTYTLHINLSEALPQRCQAGSLSWHEELSCQLDLAGTRLVALGICRGKLEGSRECHQLLMKPLAGIGSSNVILKSLL